MAKQKEKKDEDLKNAIEEIKEKFGEGAIVKLTEVRHSDVDSISTGSISLDEAIGINGVPLGRIVEIYGPEATGKTSLALHIIAEAQKKGGIAAFIDAEHALDPIYAQKIGVDIKNLLISQPSSGEEALQIVDALVRSGKINVIVIDSVAALTPQAEIDGEIGNFQIGLQARLMSQVLRRIASLVSQKRTCVIFLNQTRMKIQAYGNPETTPGGLALKFYSSVRISLRRMAKIKSGDKIIGNRIKAQIVKNKVAAPFKVAEFDIYYNQGISKEADLIQTGVKHGIIKRRGTWYSYKEERLGPGVEGAKNKLRQDKKLAKELTKEVLEKLKEEREK